MNAPTGHNPGPQPLPKSPGEAPTRPRRRDQCVLASASVVARNTWRVRLNAQPLGVNSAIDSPGFLFLSLIIVASTQLLRTKLPDQLDDRGTDSHEDDGRQNEHHQGRNHFNRRFRSLLFGALAALGAERIGVHAERLGNAGTEAVGLDESGDQGANIVNAGADHQIAEGLGARLSGTHLKIDQMKLVAKIGVGIMQIAPDAHHGLIEGESGFDAYHGEIEGVSQTQADALLAIFDHAFQGKTRDEKAQAGYSCEHEQTVET